MATPVELIKEKLSIIDVVSPYVRLVQAGKYWRGLSPFAKEKTPSFYVSPDRGVYYCFSTNQGGDIFTFVEKMEGLSFQETLHHLAERAGVSLKEATFERAKSHDRLHELLETLTLFFESHYRSSETAQTYAVSRGILPEGVSTFRIGYAPDGWRESLLYLETKGYTKEEMMEAGVIKEALGKPGTWYDRFRNRLMFPIRDSAGRVIGFSGRALVSEEGVAKYLNSPETPLFKKSSILYGIDVAKGPVRERNFTLLVEGQMDLVLSHQAGFQNTVALSGTAFGKEQLSLLSRFSKNLMLALDADRAGIASAWKNTLLAFQAGMTVKIARLPEGKDPADIIRENKEIFVGYVKSAVHAVDFFLSHALSKETDYRRQVLRVEELVLPIVLSVQSPIERDHFIRKIADATGLGEQAIRESLKKVTAIPALHNDALPDTFSGTAPDKEVLVGSDARRAPLEALLALYPDESSSVFIREALERIIPDAPALHIPERTLFEIGMTYETPPSREMAQELVNDFERVFVREAIDEASRLLRQADARNDNTLAATLTETIAKYTRRLRELSAHT